MKFKTTSFHRGGLEWPDEDIARMFESIKTINPIVASSGTKSLGLHTGSDLRCIRVARADTDECVGGCIFEFWDEHVDNCLGILTSHILPEYQHTAATHALWRELRWYAMGCKWIRTCAYVGNFTYITKYREI